MESVGERDGGMEKGKENGARPAMQDKSSFSTQEVLLREIFPPLFTEVLTGVLYLETRTAIVKLPNLK